MKPRFLLVLLFAALMPGRAAAQLAIDWFSAGFGAGTSSGGNFTLSATAGEASSGALSGGQFTINGGFWAITSQASAAPRIGIALTATNTVVISWPSSASGWSLQKNPGLDPQQWVDVLSTPANDGTRYSTVVNVSPGTLYLRLRR